MEEFVAIVPVALALISLIGTIFNLKTKAKAEHNFVVALNKELKKKISAGSEGDGRNAVLSDDGLRRGDNDPALVRSLYREALSSSATNREATNIVVLALNDLAAKDKKYIKSTLENNTVRGRARYISKVFRRAVELATKAAI